MLSGKLVNPRKIQTETLPAIPLARSLTQRIVAAIERT
jgi:hypothetical protein